MRMPKRHASDRGLSSLRVTAKEIAAALEVHALSRRRGMSNEANAACFIVRDANGQALGYFYFEDEPRKTVACRWQSC
jgi:hypothetical protein